MADATAFFRHRAFSPAATTTELAQFRHATSRRSLHGTTLYAIVDDIWKLGEAARNRSEVPVDLDLDEAGFGVMRWVFRCTVLGVLIATVMKLQSSYLTSSGENILAWLLSDLSSALYERADAGIRFSYTMPTHYSSLLVAISACVVFLYGAIRLGVGSQFHIPLYKMSGVVALLVGGYLLIDAFSGFSLLLGVAGLLAIYGLVDPGFSRARASKSGNDQSVS